MVRCTFKKVLRIVAMVMTCVVILNVITPEWELIFRKNTKRKTNMCRRHPEMSQLYNVVGEMIDFIGYKLRLYNTVPFSTFSSYPMDINLKEAVDKIKGGGQVDVKPIYNHDITSMLKPDVTCKSIDLLILVKSAAQHQINRDVIRDTWGMKNRNTKFKTIFIVGKNKCCQDLIDAESKLNNDILQISAVDHLHNNTIKLVHGLQWSLAWCPNAKYTLIIDDDYIAFPERIIHFISDFTHAYLYMGNKNNNRIPHRSSLMKWRLTYSEYPYDQLPEYITAGSILMSRQFVQDVVFAVPYVKLLHDDGVYLAIIAYKLDVIPIHTSTMHIDHVFPYKRHFRYVLTSHGYTCVDDVIISWEYYKGLGQGHN